MCGIVGIVQNDFSRPVEKQSLNDMIESLRHRGPDDSGSVVVQGVGLGMRRLSIIDVQGGHKLKDRLPDARLVLILPPSWEELERRLRGRGTDSDEVIARRMAAAKQEMISASDYEEIIVNEDLASAVAQAESMIRLLRRTTDGRNHLQALVSAD